MGLDSTSFAATLRDYEMVFVSFYAPWCGHCTAIDSELKEAAMSLHREGHQARIALVDATAEKNKELTRRESIEGFPTLILYKDGKRLTEYHGQRKHK
jgi:thiol-disulfide isomerase/thioredoxin